jgi:hypothetical protein
MRKARPDLAARMDLELATPEHPARLAAPSATLAGPEEEGEGRGPIYVPPSRQNMKRIQGYFSPRVKRQLRMLAAQSDKTEEQLVGEALNMLFQIHGLPAIAFESKERAP